MVREVALFLIVSTSALASDVAVPSSAEIASYIEQGLHVRPDPTRPEAMVSRVRRSDFDALFKKHCLFDACTSGIGLTTAILPHGGSCGFFASDGKQIRYLNWDHKRGLELVLGEESLPLESLDTFQLSNLLSEAILQRDNKSEVVLRSASDLSGGWIKPFDGYVLNEEVRGLLETRIQAPRTTGSSATGWSVEYFALEGWMHMKNTVVREVFTISPRYEISVSREVLTERAFSKIPNIVY